MSDSRRLWLALVVLVLLSLTAACSGPPETQVYIVLTATHEPPTLTALAVETAEPGSGNITAETPPASGIGPLTVVATPAMPTPVVTQIQVAEQSFQNGRMFWLQPSWDIWVMVYDEGTTEHGTWLIYDDTFVEGEVEIDPELTPPADTIQPRRGFGKLWRQNEEVRELVGWATTPEYGFVTTYEYRPGGYLDSAGRYVPGPGIHLLTSLGNEVFAFEEEDMTWRLVK